MVDPVPTECFLQLSPEAVMLFAHPSTSPCPALIAGAEPKSQGHCRK